MKKVFLIFILLFIQSTLFAQAGMIDSTFGVNGKFTLDREFGSDLCNAMAVAPDGKIFLLSNGSTLTRLNANGSLDSTFGDAGSLGVLPLWNEELYGSAIAVDSLNQILVYAVDDYYDKVRVFRYLEDGSPDLSFGGEDGILLPLYRSSRALMMQSDGKILAGGEQDEYYFLAGCVARLNNDGSFDQTFNGSGTFSFDNLPSSYVFAISQQSDEKLLVTGTANQDMFIARLNSDGTLDSTFAAIGYTVFDNGNAEAGQGVTEMTDGKILVVGHTENGSESSMLCWRFLPDGTVDYSFGDSGVATLFTGAENNFAWFVFANNDTTAIVGGSTFNGNFYQAVMYRFLNEGTIDNSFGENGIGGKTFVCGPSYQVNGGRTAGGKILVSGTGFNSGNNLVTVSEFSANGIADSLFAEQGTASCPALQTAFLNDQENILVLPDDKILSQNLFRITKDGVLDSTYGENGFYYTPPPFVFRNFISTNGNFIYQAGTNSGEFKSPEKLILLDYPYPIVIRKLNSEGLPDSSFGTNGIFRLQFMNSMNLFLRDMKVQADDKLLLVIIAPTDSQYLLRLNTDGNLDQTFADSGSLLLSIDNIALRDDGKINTVNYEYPLPQFLASRFFVDGSVDPSFGNNVVVALPSGLALIYPQSLVLQADNKMLLLSHDNIPPGEVLLRVNEDGTIDNDFNSVGYVDPIGTDYYFPYPYLPALPEPNGKILVGETVHNYGENHSAIGCYLSNGAIDPSFGTNGLSLMPGGNYSSGSLKFQSDGKIIFEVFPTYDFSMFRVLNDEAVSVSDIENSRQLQIFPTPTSNQLFINYPFSSNEQTTITIRDITGKVMEEITGKFSSSNYSIDVNELPAGIYLLTIQEKNNLISEKFVKE